jgi:hypothetical protein
MKPLVNTAVLGLVPMPPRPDTSELHDKHDAPPPTNRRVPVSPYRVAVERMATPEELERIRHQLEDTGIG